MNDQDKKILAACSRIKAAAERLEAGLIAMNNGVTTSVNGIVKTSGTVFDPIEAVALKGEQSYQLAGGGWTLCLYEAVEGLDSVWERFLDCAFVEPWKTPEEKRAQCIAIQSVMRCMFTAAQKAGLTVTLYTKAK